MAESALKGASIEALGIHRSFGSVQALQGVDLSVGPGQIVGLLGANGSGKSTLNQILVGLLRPDQGEVRIGGLSLAEDGDRARGLIGYAPEFPSLYDALTGQEHLDFVGGLRGLSPPALRSQSAFWLDRLSIADAAARPVGGWSQGMRRKLALALAFIAAPPVLLLDEPTNGLDPPAIALLRALLGALRERGHAILVASHILAFVERSCDALVVLERGRVVARGTLEEVTATAGDQRQLEDTFLALTGAAPAGALLPGSGAPEGEV